MAASFPTSIPNLPDPGATLGTTGGATAHAAIHVAIEEELVAIATKLGADSSASMTLASGVVAHGSGWLGAASTRAAGFVVTRGLLQNTSGSTIVAGTAIAQVSAAHRPAGNLSFPALFGTGTATRVDVNGSGQVVLSANWATSIFLTVGGFVWAV